MSINRHYYPKDTKNKPIQIHGFCNASEIAYARVVYIRITDTHNNTHVYVSLVMSKTKVVPKKRQTIPCLELCGAHIVKTTMSC